MPRSARAGRFLAIETPPAPCEPRRGRTAETPKRTTGRETELATTERWKKAQAYEQGFWEGVARRAAEGSMGQIDFYEWRAGSLKQRLESLGMGELLDGTARIAELGSGPVGVVGFLPGVERVAIDPLNGFYAQNEELTAFRNPEVRYIEAEGEEVPLESAAYDLVIMENCIDHVRDVNAVMSEIHRVLAPGGVLYLTVNARSRLGYWIHRVLARLALDPGHPHTFTAGRFNAMLRRGGFEILEFEAGSWWKAWKEDLSSGRWKGRAKGVLLVSEHVLAAVARKPPEARE
jgi:SAM-dependent methyltransferase